MADQLGQTLVELLVDQMALHWAERWESLWKDCLWAARSVEMTAHWKVDKSAEHLVLVLGARWDDWKVDW